MNLWFDEVGDSYLRIQFCRPRWPGPLNRGVTDAEAVVGEYVLHVWEDPTDSLLRNAMRLTRGRQPQRYSLVRKEVCGKDLPLGEVRSVIVEGLRADTPHFVTLAARTRTLMYDEPIRISVKTAPETRLSGPVMMWTRSFHLKWFREPPAVLPHCNLDVVYPAHTNMFTDRDESHPYVGQRRQYLPEGAAWNLPPVVTDPHAKPGYEVSCTDLASGHTVVVATEQCEATVSGLQPSAAHYVRVRTVPDRGNAKCAASPWSRPFLVLTPTNPMCRVVHRSATKISFVWGRRLPPHVMPLAPPPGHPRYLPDINEEGDYYYYLEPLPFVSGPGLPSDGDMSDSETEEDVYADDVLAERKSYFGRKPRIVNRNPHDPPLEDLPLQCCDSVEEVILLLMLGEHYSRTLEENSANNYYKLDLPRECEESGKLVARVQLPGCFGEYEFKDLEADTQYTAYLFTRVQGAHSFQISDRFTTFTLKASTVEGCTPCAVCADQPSFWSSLIVERLLWAKESKEKKCAPSNDVSLEVEEVSEVFAILRITRSEIPEAASSVVMCSSPMPPSGCPNEEHDDVVSEYLLQISALEMSSDSWREVGVPQSAYYATSSSVIQIVGLSAATRYEIRITRMCNATQQWTAYSAPLSITTLPKLHMDVDEISAEYAKLKWGRSRMDNIRNFSFIVRDLHHPEPGTVETFSESSTLPDGEVSAGFTSTTPTTKATTVVTLSKNWFRLALLQQLRHNAMFDVCVVPHYHNGEHGVESTPLRIVHCLVAARVAECGVNHFLVEWDPIDYDHLLGIRGVPNAPRLHATGKFLVRLRHGSEWERTIQLPGDATSCILGDLSALSEYTLSIAFSAILGRDPLIPPVNPTEVLRCAQPFAIRAKTLTTPTAEVTKLGESCVELAWTFYAEAEHAGEITMEVRFVDTRRSESFSRFATCQTARGETIGHGSATVEGLLPERLYTVHMRQRFSRGTWGDWQRVLEGVSTLRRIQVSVDNVSETFFTLSAFRQPWKLSEGTDPSMQRAQQINLSLWRFAVEHYGTEEKKYVEATEPSAVIDQLEPATPYKVSVQQRSLTDWGEPSQPYYIYTLAPLLPTVHVRADNYLEIGFTRDTRCPPVACPHCNPHDLVSSAKHSCLSSIHVAATSLLGMSSSTSSLSSAALTIAEKEIPNASVKLSGLLPAHPYRVDLVTTYGARKGEGATSLATVTLPMPEISIVDIGEESVTVMWKASTQAVTHYATFASLPSHVRHAPTDGREASVTHWEMRAEPAVSDSSFSRQLSLDAPEVLVATTPRQYFQDPQAVCALTRVDATNHRISLIGLLPQQRYNLFFRSVDSNESPGWFVPCGSATTVQFAKLSINKLAENFAEVSWSAPPPPDLLSTPRLGATEEISMSMWGSGTKHDSPMSRKSIVVSNVANTSSKQEKYEIFVFSLDHPEWETATVLVDYATGHALIENLQPKTRYVAIGRTRRTVGGEEVITGAWGAQARFETLALLVLRVVAISLDFVNVTWQGADNQVAAPNQSDTPNAHAADEDSAVVEFPALVHGTSTYFAATCPSTSFSAAAAAVRFQLRVMEADSDGEIGELKEDMFVATTADGIHTIRSLLPAASYAISMRVCYEGISGSWVEPAIITTDCIPEPKMLKITQSSAEMLFRVQRAASQPHVTFVPERTHRLYEILIREHNSVKKVYVKGREDALLRLSHLKRDFYYHIDLRELIRGVAYGEYTPLTTLWTQPYAPIITELAECRDDMCEIRWGIMDNVRVGCVLTMDHVPPGFVYSFERGLRVGTTDTGKDWEEIAVTDYPMVRWQWRKPGSTVPFSSFCFRVRLSKQFVTEPGRSCKVPVWGDYSNVAVWRDPPRRVS